MYLNSDCVDLSCNCRYYHCGHVVKLSYDPVYGLCRATSLIWTVLKTLIPSETILAAVITDRAIRASFGLFGRSFINGDVYGCMHARTVSLHVFKPFLKSHCLILII